MAHKKYKTESLSKNYFFNILMQGLNMLFPFITIPYVTRVLGPENLGRINFANSIVQYFLLFAALGIPIYAIREIARVRDDSKKIKTVFFEIFLIQSILTIISLTFYLLLVTKVDILQEDEKIFLFLGLQIVSNALDCTWFIKAVEKYRYLAMSIFFSKLINIVLIFLFLENGEQYELYALFIGISFFTNIFINFIISLYILRQFSTGQGIKIKSDNLKSHFQGLVFFFFSLLSIKVYTLVDQTMLGVLSSSEAVGYYSMGMMLIKVILTFITSMSLVMLPRISNAVNNQQIEQVKGYISISIKAIFLLAIPTIFGIQVIGKEIITVFLGNEFKESIIIFKSLSILLLIIGINNVFVMQILTPLGKEKRVALFLALAAVTNFLLNLMLIPSYSYYGAILATIATELIVVLLLYKEVKKIMGNLVYLIEAWKYFLASFMFLLLITVMKKYITTPVYILVFSVLGSSLVYFVSLIILKESLTLIGLEKILKRWNKRKL